MFKGWLIVCSIINISEVLSFEEVDVPVDPML